jgi:hypothetical protein
MSYDTHKTWLYRLEGRYIHLYQYIDGVSTDTLAGIRIALPSEYYGKQLIYPNEDIANGLRVEYTGLIDTFVGDAWEDLTGRYSDDGISFTASTRVIALGSGNTWLSAGFADDDKIRIIGSASNDGDYTIDDGVGTSIASGATSIDLISSDSLTDESAGESITIYQIPDEDTTPDETNHINLNRLLSLAVADYLKAQLSDSKGDIQMKEYYMKEFWKKIGDNESNKRKISMTFPTSPFAVR